MVVTETETGAWGGSACREALDGAPSTKAITVEAFRIDALLAARKGLTPTCSRSEAGTIFASSSYAGSAGTRPRCDISDENVLISTLLEQQSGPVIGRVLRGYVGALSPTASMGTSSRRADGHSSTPAACRQHSKSFDGLCEGRACFVLGDSVCSRTPYRFCRNHHAGKARHSEKAQQRRCQSTQSRPIELVISLWFGGAQKNQNGKTPNTGRRPFFEAPWRAHGRIVG